MAEKVTSKKNALIHFGSMIAISIVLIFAFFYVYLPITTNHGETIQVPDLKGKTVAQLEEELDALHLGYQVNDSSYIAGATPYTVLSQHPLTGSEVKENRKIYLTITSKNPPLVMMPMLIDKSIKAAEMELKSRDLILAGKNEVPSPFSNLVIKQYANGKEIAEGTQIPKGTKITLDVGNGSMPDVVEQPTLEIE